MSLCGIKDTKDIGKTEHVSGSCTVHDYISLSQENCMPAVLIIITTARGRDYVFSYVYIPNYLFMNRIHTDVTDTFG